MSEPWNESEAVTFNVTLPSREDMRDVVSTCLTVATNLTCYTAVAGFVYMSMLRREYREHRESARA